MEKIAIGITCVGSLIGQGVIKSIRASDLADRTRLIGFEYFPGTVGSYWVEDTYLMPDILKPDVPWKAYLEVLCDHIRHHSIRLLFIGMDFELPMFATHRQHIQDKTGCVVVVSSPEVISMAQDKYETYRFLEKNNLNRPTTWLPREVADVTYPVVVKPREGQRSVGVHVVKNRETLEKTLQGVDNPLIQEEIGTKDQEYTCAVLYLDGEVKTMVCMRRYLRDGNTSVAYHSPHTPEAVHGYVDALAQCAKPFGPCNFQLRLDGSGCPKLFEINARFSGTTHIRTLFGVNEVEYVVKHLLGLETPCFTPRFGKAIRYLEDMYVPEGK
jgi:carbamoyl-phosphate synthase large subunit